MKKVSLFIVPLLLLAACQSDKTELAKKEILTADRTFSALSEKEGMHAAFLEYIDEDGVMLRPNSYPIVGKDQIKKGFDLTDDSGYTLIWEPLAADASVSGDMGYSYGKYSLLLPDTTHYGTYVSVWKKVNGNWRFVLDAGNEGLGTNKD